MSTELSNDPVVSRWTNPIKIWVVSQAPKKEGTIQVPDHSPSSVDMLLPPPPPPKKKMDVYYPPWN